MFVFLKYKRVKIFDNGLNIPDSTLTSAKMCLRCFFRASLVDLEIIIIFGRPGNYNYIWPTWNWHRKNITAISTVYVQIMKPLCCQTQSWFEPMKPLELRVLSLVQTTIGFATAIFEFIFEIMSHHSHSAGRLRDMQVFYTNLVDTRLSSCSKLFQMLKLGTNVNTSNSAKNSYKIE